MTTQNQNPKKSETLEFRLPYDEKANFLAQVSQNGQSASDALRQLVVDYVKPAKATKSKGLWAIGVVVAAMGLVAVPVLADRTLFASYDIDGNGRITAGEITSKGDSEIIEALDTNKNGWVSILEFKASGSGESFAETINDLSDGKPNRMLAFTFVVFELEAERKVSQKIDTYEMPIAMEATQEEILSIQANLREQRKLVKQAAPKTP